MRLRELHHAMTERRLIAFRASGETQKGKIIRLETEFPSGKTTGTLWTSGGQRVQVPLKDVGATGL